MKKAGQKKRQAVLAGLGSLIDVDGQTTRRAMRKLGTTPKRLKALGPMMLETSVLFSRPPSSPSKSSH